MKKTYSTRLAYERPWTEKVVVEVEGTFASSVTEYENAGSAGSGDHVDNPFTEFGASAPETSGVGTDTFGSWESYN